MAALLGGCATGGSSGGCQPLVSYSAEAQLSAADALRGAAPVLRGMIEDYGDLRARVRAACGK